MSTLARPTSGCPSGLAPPSLAVAGDLSAFVRNDGSLKTLQLSVTGARCGGCLSKIEQAVSSLPGIETARLNLSNGRLSTAWHGDLCADRVAKTVSDLGYGVSAFVEDDVGAAAKREERQLLMSMGVAGFAAANIMLLSVSVWAGHGEMGETTRRSLHALSGIIALPVLLFSGRHFFRSALSALKAGHANMDVPISLALVLAYSVSVWETVRGSPHAYFDACAMLIFFLLIGRFLDARLRRQAHTAAHSLAALRNRAVKRLNAAGQVESVKAQDVRSGDTIILAAGERTVIDLIVTQGNGSIDESLVTGESLPRTISQGQILYAGSINIDQPLQGRARGEAGDSLLSEIADMLEAGEQQRSAYRRIADRAVGLYVPFVHSAALLAFLTWVILGASVGAAIMIAVSTLIITCPCALALAAPVTQVVASGRLHRQGVFLRSGDALERLAEIDHVVFDKTGTLTLGEPVLASQHAPYELMAAARLARASRHPLSRALVNAAGPGQVAAEVKETAGLGLEATIDGALSRLGSAEWVGANADTQTGAPSIWYVEGDADPVLFRFEDRLRDDALASVGALKAAGLGIEILSGDRPGAVERAAATLGIDHWTARVSSSQKGARLKVLREEGRKVLMIGDGLNDAGALSLAHAAVAPGGAIDISQSAADAVFSDGLLSVPALLSGAKQARHVMRQNFTFAAGYNLVAVPVAFAGLVTPLVAAIAMSASSLIVTLNALRLHRGA